MSVWQEQSDNEFRHWFGHHDNYNNSAVAPQRMAFHAGYRAALMGLCYQGLIDNTQLDEFLRRLDAKL